MDEITELLLQEPEKSDYDDILVRQLFDTIQVMDENTLLITFKWGQEYRQNIDTKVRKLKRTT